MAKPLKFVLLVILGLFVAAAAAALLQANLQAPVEAEVTEVMSPEAPFDSALVKIQNGYQSLTPIFTKGCFDCHSAQPRYPWYHKLPVIGSVMDGHIREGQKRLNFSASFPVALGRKMPEKLQEIRDEITSGGMPLLGYRMLHWNAKPSAEEERLVVAWIDSSLAALAKYGIMSAADGSGEKEGEEKE